MHTSVTRVYNIKHLCNQQKCNVLEKKYMIKEGNKVTPARLSAIKEGLPIINRNTCTSIINAVIIGIYFNEIRANLYFL